VRVIRLSVCATGAVLALAIATAGGASRRPDAGIRGRVLYGPTCPVQRPGKTCVRPYEAAITIRREPAGTVVAHIRSTVDGRFTVRLRPGSYLLAPRNGKPYPRAQSQTVSVQRHHFTAVTIRYDSGIR
jgi:hypothetical protein